MSLRTSIAAAGTALVLLGGLMVGMSLPAVAHDHWKPWGATRAPDQTLKPGCHRYRYHYRINPPTNSWAAEIFLVNRRGVRIAHDALASESDPARAWRKWSTQICRVSTVYGRHKIRMKITYIEDPDDPTPDSVEGWVRPSYFRLRRP